MSQSRLAISIELLRQLLHLPPDVLIAGVHYCPEDATIDLVIEGPTVPDEHRVIAIVHQERTWMELQPAPALPATIDGSQTWRMPRSYEA